MKRITLFSLIIFLTVGCSDLVDFTEVENPNLSEASVVGQPNSASIWLTGIERQLANVLNEIVINAEIASDNYMNDQTFFNQFLDGLNINSQDNDVIDIEFDIHRLREMAKFGTNEVGPGDPNIDATVSAEFLFFEGLSHLYAAMYYTGFPSEPGGAVLSSADNYARAIALFDQAIATNSLPEYHLAKARAQYYTGDQAGALKSATDATTVSADFMRAAQFDELEEPDNVMEDALYERGTFDDLQPLPTLDFLDPKYSFNTAGEDDPIRYLKAEEGWLIRIEAMIASGDLAAAQGMMGDLLALVQARGMKEVDDSIEGRTHFAEGTRPDSSCIEVNGRMGLVLDRDQGNVMIPNISGTSLTQADIDGIGSEDDALYLLYRTRQEIFIAEGLRMADMGVKLVISEIEELQNDNVTSGGTGTTAQIPSFIEAVKDQLDGITYDPGSCTASTMIDLNMMLVNNKGDAAVLPFH